MLKDPKDNRRHRRHAIPGKVRIFWRDAYGHSFQAMGQVVDISRSGVRLRIDKPIAPMTTLNLQSPDFRIAGVAVARRCERRGLTYEVGIQFAGGLEWFRAPEEKE